MIYTHLKRNAPRCYFWRVSRTQTAWEQFSKMLLLGPFTHFMEWAAGWLKLVVQLVQGKKSQGRMRKNYMVINREHILWINFLLWFSGPVLRKSKTVGENTTGIPQFSREFLKLSSGRCNMLTLLLTEHTGNWEADTATCAYKQTDNTLLRDVALRNWFEIWS